MSTTSKEAAFSVAEAYCRTRGAEEGRSAASWVFDGNTSRETYAAILKGLEDGDPAIFDQIPTADLSGEMADATSGPSLVRDALAEAGCDASSDECGDWFTDLCDAYEDAFGQAVSDELTRVARYQLDDEQEGSEPGAPDVWTLLEQDAPDGCDAVQDLYSWSLNFDSGRGPFALFLDIIRWSEENVGEPLYDLRRSAMGYVECAKLAAALTEYADRPHDVYAYVETLMSAESNG